jgi:hypothetical protein
MPRATSMSHCERACSQGSLTRDSADDDQDVGQARAGGGGSEESDETDNLSGDEANAAAAARISAKKDAVHFRRSVECGGETTVACEVGDHRLSAWSRTS